MAFDAANAAFEHLESQEDIECPECGEDMENNDDGSFCPACGYED